MHSSRRFSRSGKVIPSCRQYRFSVSLAIPSAPAVRVREYLSLTKAVTSSFTVISYSALIRRGQSCVVRFMLPNLTRFAAGAFITMNFGISRVGIFRAGRRGHGLHGTTFGVANRRYFRLGPTRALQLIL